MRAVDGAGNVDGTPGSYFWTVEAPPRPSCVASTRTAAADRDAWVLQSSASSNFGNDSVLKVDTKSGGNARALVRFALPAIPAGCTVKSATLRLYSGSYKEGRTLQALRLGATFDRGLGQLEQPAGDDRHGRERPVALERRLRRVERARPRSRPCTPATNTGFLIRDASENGGGLEQSFNSREKGADNPPQLVITFG